MKYFILLFLALSCFPTPTLSQVGIGTTNPEASAALDVDSNNKGFLPPRMSSAERDAISNPADGLVIFNTNTSCIEQYIGGQWFNMCVGDLSPELENDDVLDPLTGQVFLNKNLGANQVATSPIDAASYGDLYQWGRAAEGHEIIFRVAGDAPTSGVYNGERNPTPSTATESGSWDGEFIVISRLSFNRDWLNPQDNNLWQGVSGVNNPCPTGYRVPTEAEWMLQVNNWNSPDASGAYASVLKLPMSGFREFRRGNIVDAGVEGSYWTSTVDGVGARSLNFNTSNATTNRSERALAMSIRCIKD